MAEWAHALVKAGLLPRDALAAAESRQRDIGGTLDTNLLELGQIDEATVLAYKAAACGLAAAPIEALAGAGSIQPRPGASERPPPRGLLAGEGQRAGAQASEVRPGSLLNAAAVHRWLPAPVAVRYQLVPIARDEGSLTVAVEEPLAPTVAAELAFLAGRTLVQQMALPVRLRLALAQLYRLPVDPRLGSLAERLGSLEGGSVRSNRAGSLPRAATLTPPVPPFPGARTDTHATRDTVSFQPSGGSEPPPAPSSGRVASEPVPRFREREATRPFIELSVSRALPQSESMQPARTSGAEASERPERGTRRRLVSEPGSEYAGPSGPPVSASELHRRYPLTSIQTATHGDEILSAFVGFCGGILNYAALFAIYEDVAELKYESTKGEVRRRTDLAIPLEMPHAIALAVSECVLRVVDLRASDFDAFIASRLGRSGAQPAVVVPVAAKGRVFAVLLGDLEGHSFSEPLLSALDEFAPLVARSLLRLLKRKRST